MFLNVNFVSQRFLNGGKEVKSFKWTTAIIEYLSFYWFLQQYT